jgi:hypothetical protein
MTLSSSTKKTFSSAASTTTTTSSNNGGLKMTYINLALLIIIPYLMGIYISNQNLALMKRVLQPLMVLSTTGFLNKSRHPSSSSSANNSQRNEASLQRANERSVLSSTTPTSSSVFALKCFDRLVESMSSSSTNQEQDNKQDALILKAFENIDLVLHHNGQAQACGRLTKNLVQGMRDVLLRELQQDDGSTTTTPCPLWSDKYHVESFLTRVFRHLLINVDGQCASNDEEHDIPGFYGYCDRGVARTPILLDHDKLVRIPSRDDSSTTTTLPCHFHSPVGVRITSLSLLLSEAVSAASFSSKSEQQAGACSNNGDNTAESCVATTEDDDESSKNKKEFHVYAVPAGRVFMFAPSHVGQVIPLPHTTGGDPNQPVELHVLSVHPRIFDITNFFTKEESNDVVQRALEETRETHKIKRSSTGATGYNINTQRTSESGFDTEGATAMILKRRGMALLGFDEYMEGHTDGLQVLRYNLTTAYIPHMDWCVCENSIS